MRRHRLEVVDAVFGQVARDRLGIGHRVRVQDVQLTAGGETGEHHGVAQVRRLCLQQRVATARLSEPHQAWYRRHVVRQRAVGDRHPLWRAGGPRRVDHISRRGWQRRRVERRRVRGHRAGGRGIVHRDGQHPCGRKLLEHRLGSEEQRGPAVGEHERDPFGGQARIDGQIGRSGLPGRKDPRDDRRAARQAQRHHALRSRPQPAQMTRQPAGALVQLPIGHRGAGAHDRRRVGRTGRLRLEHLHHRRGRQFAAGVVPPFEHHLALDGVEEIGMVDPGPRVRRSQPGQGLEKAPRDVPGRSRVAEFRVEVDGDLDSGVRHPVVGLDLQVFGRTARQTGQDGFARAEPQRGLDGDDIDDQAVQRAAADKLHVAEDVGVLVSLVRQRGPDRRGGLLNEPGGGCLRADPDPDRHDRGGHAGDPTLPPARPAVGRHAEHEVVRSGSPVVVNGGGRDQQAGHVGLQAPGGRAQGRGIVGADLGEMPYRLGRHPPSPLTVPSHGLRQRRQRVEPEPPVLVDVGGVLIRLGRVQQHGHGRRRPFAGIALLDERCVDARHAVCDEAEAGTVNDAVMRALIP